MFWCIWIVLAHSPTSLLQLVAIPAFILQVDVIARQMTSACKLETGIAGGRVRLFYLCVDPLLPQPLCEPLTASTSVWTPYCLNLCVDPLLPQPLCEPLTASTSV